MAADDAQRCCALCEGKLEPGFTCDFMHVGAAPEHWAPGEPQRSFWTGIKMPARLHAVRAYRCTSCGYLMQFVSIETRG